MELGGARLKQQLRGNQERQMGLLDLEKNKMNVILSNERQKNLKLREKVHGQKVTSLSFIQSRIVKTHFC